MWTSAVVPLRGGSHTLDGLPHSWCPGITGAASAILGGVRTQTGDQVNLDPGTLQPLLLLHTHTHTHTHTRSQGWPDDPRSPRICTYGVSLGPPWSGHRPGVLSLASEPQCPHLCLWPWTATIPQAAPIGPERSLCVVSPGTLQPRLGEGGPGQKQGRQRGKAWVWGEF